MWLNSTNTGEMAWTRRAYYDARLGHLDEFWGFFPRTYLPGTKLYNSETGDTTKITLFFIDSHKEIKTGVGLNFPPTLLLEG